MAARPPQPKAKPARLQGSAAPDVAHGPSLTPLQDDESTQERLLQAAERLFAKHGVAGTTIRDLAAAARVNVAAIHYHFGGKDELYAETLRRVASRALPALPTLQAIVGNIDGARDRRRATREALRLCVKEFMSTLFQGAKPTIMAELMLRETVEPSDAFKRIFREFIEPQWDTLVILLGFMQPALVGTDRIKFVASSVVGQCLYFHQNTQIVSLTFGKSRHSQTFIDQAAEHVAAFTIAALDTEIP